MSCCENGRPRWWELSSPLALRYAPIHSFTWEPHTGLRRGQQPARLMNARQKLLLTGELQKSSVFIYSFFSFSCLLPPYFYSPRGARLYISPIVALFKKERKGRVKQNRAQVWERFLLSLFPSVVSLLTLSMPTRAHLGPSHILPHETQLFAFFSTLDTTMYTKYYIQ